MKKLTLLLLLFISTAVHPKITILGITCDDMVIVNPLQPPPSTVVCIQALDKTRSYLLSVSDSFDFVTLAYQVLLWRDPDPAGEAYWFNALTSNRITKAQLLDSFISSAEYIALRK